MPDVEPAAAEDTPTALAERDRVERALDRLPIDQRAVVVLHFHLGLPLTEVAQIVDIPVGTAKSRLSRGLEALRTAMRAEPDARPVPVTERAR
jgi:RNA polymerase sigma-70 factor (ECF subfamily)